ncbi:MAG: hypothetical protein LBT24_04235 [Tannerella sp.]|jgi:hypothetical protein|nr:hypothetical protein [Tannerella sp.]
MNIQLLFDFKGIPQSKWEKAWLKCVEILDAFPVPPAVLHEKKHEIAGKEESYYVWSDKVVLDENTKDECLAVRGDYLSLEYGGTFKLYRYLSHYADHPTSEKHVLWCDWNPDDENFHFKHPDDDPRCIWDDGTQGAPYFLAILALGIYLENRFPENCFLYGEYSDYQLERMQFWLSAVLQKSVSTPVCNDPERLFCKLATLFPDTELLVRRFLALCKRSLHESFAFLIDKGYNEVLQKELISQLEQYNSPQQWGASDLLLPYLYAIRDVEAVIALVKSVQKAKNGDGFSLTDLLKLLVDNGITIKPYESGAETVREWNKTGESLTTGMESITRIFLRMSGMPEKMNYYLSADQLLEIFACTEPANGVQFQQIIEERTKTTSEDYKKLEKATDNLIDGVTKKQNESATSYYITKKHWIRRRYLPSEEYILMEVEKQCFTCYQPKKTTSLIGKSIGLSLFNYEQKAGKSFGPSTAEEVRQMIVHHVTECGFALRETAWQAIENEKDLDMLKLLLVYACTQKKEIHFWGTRKFIFETPELWPNMKKALLNAWNKS